MRDVSQTYKDIRESGLFHYEVQILNGERTYGMNVIKTLKIRSSLLQDSLPSIGGTSSSEIDLELFEESENWGRGSVFSVLFRILSDDNSLSSEWIISGFFYTDTRKYSNGVLKITGYDAMLLTETTWYDKVVNDLPYEFPLTAYEATTLALSAVEFGLDGDTVLDNSVGFIGLNTNATVRDTLSDVAAGMAGNWTITPDGNFKLVPFKRVSGRTGTSAIAGIAIAGRSVIGKSQEEEDIPVIELNNATKQFSKSNILDAIVGVELTSDDGTVASSAPVNGYWMKAHCNFSNSYASYLSLKYINNYKYKPFVASGAFLDPIAELGDFVVIDGQEYVIYEMSVTFGAKIIMEISAPYEEEIDHEYKIEDKSTKNLRKALQAVNKSTSDVREELNSSIVQTAREIRTEVSENYYDVNSVDTLINGVHSEVIQTADGLTVSITNVQREANDSINEITKYISYVDGVVTLGETENPSVLKVSSEEVGLYYNGIKTTYWNQNEQVTPNKVRIPAGGSLQEGNFIWQPRSSGNLSLMWVGG